MRVTKLYNASSKQMNSYGGVFISNFKKNEDVRRVLISFDNRKPIPLASALVLSGFEDAIGVAISGDDLTIRAWTDDDWELAHHIDFVGKYSCNYANRKYPKICSSGVMYSCSHIDDNNIDFIFPYRTMGDGLFTWRSCDVHICSLINSYRGELVNKLVDNKFAVHFLDCDLAYIYSVDSWLHARLVKEVFIK